MLRQRPSARSAHGRIAIGLGLALCAAILPGAAFAAGPSSTDARLRPTIHYEDAVAHADDRISFRPGGRVTVPFKPRPGDRWKVDGAAPRSLPAGRETGRAMRIGTTGARPRPDDRPAVDHDAVTPADDAVWDATGEPSFDLAAAVDPGALRREVFGFLPYWELADSSTRLDWDKISTVAYFGVGADGNGNLMKTNSDGSTTVGWSGWTSAKMTSVIEAAHQSHARVVLTVQSFAWSSAGLKRQKALLGSATARSRLARQIAAAVRDRGADGVNLDFEPVASGYADEFTALVRKVRAVLKATAPGYQLTFDTTGWIGNYPIEAATRPGGADAIFIMGYDYRSSGSNPVGSIAPIGGPTYDVANTLRAYLDRVPASKLILGVPYYGRAWSTSSDKLHSKNISGTKYGSSVSAVYTLARELAAENGRRYDTTEGVAWTAYRRETCTDRYGCVTSWRQLYYDDARAIKAKYDLVNRYGLRGAGIWALGYDGTRTELYQAIENKFITDTIPPAITGSSLSSSVISPNEDGRLDTSTATLKATALVRWGYVIQRMQGSTAGPSIRSGNKPGKRPSFTWNGTDADAEIVGDGTYRITLWAADVSDNRSERRFTVTVDTRRATVASRTSRSFLTPDGNGHSDTLGLGWSSNEAVSGTVRIRDHAGTTVRAWTFTKQKTWSTTWTGKDRTSAVVPDGRYTLQVDGRDRGGNRTVEDRPVLVDRTIRSVRWADGSFDPRARQSSRALITLRRSATVTVAIYRGGTLVRAIWTDRALAAGTYGWTWTGKTSPGAFVKPGRYRIVVVATSKLGTTRDSRSVTIQPH